jgi:hypothetical protein
MTLKLARAYLGRPDGALFLEPRPSGGDAWTPYPGLSAERAAALALDVHQAMAREARESAARASKGGSLGRTVKRISKRSFCRGKARVSRLRPGSKRKPAVSASRRRQ